MSLDDIASDFEEHSREVALKLRKPELQKTGFCWWCNEETVGVYCSPECRDDHTQSQRFNLNASKSSL